MMKRADEISHVFERYDRFVDKDNTIICIHQEDF